MQRISVGLFKNLGKRLNAASIKNAAESIRSFVSNAADSIFGNEELELAVA